MAEHWYVATLIVQCKVEGHPKRLPLVDEQIRILRAPNKETAYEKAVQLGKDEETSYLNGYGEQVLWEFVGLVDLSELEGEIQDGTEVRSRLFHKRHPDMLVCQKDDLTVFAWEQERREREK
jgi:hypothetical protein